MLVLLVSSLGSVASYLPFMLTCGYTSDDSSFGDRYATGGSNVLEHWLYPNQLGNAIDTGRGFVDIVGIVLVGIVGIQRALSVKKLDDG